MLTDYMLNMLHQRLYKTLYLKTYPRISSLPSIIWPIWDGLSETQLSMKTTSASVHLQFSLCRICCEWMQQWIAVTSSLWSSPFADLSLSIHTTKIIMFLIPLFKCVSCAMAATLSELVVTCSWRGKKGTFDFLSFHPPIVQISEWPTVMCYRKTCRRIIWLQLHLIELCVSSSTCATILLNPSVCFHSSKIHLNKHISEMP